MAEIPVCPNCGAPSQLKLRQRRPDGTVLDSRYCPDCEFRWTLRDGHYHRLLPSTLASYRRERSRGVAEC